MLSISVLVMLEILVGIVTIVIRPFDIDIS